MTSLTTPRRSAIRNAVVPQREIGAPASGDVAVAFQIEEAMSQPLTRRGPL